MKKTIRYFILGIMLILTIMTIPAFFNIILYILALAGLKYFFDKFDSQPEENEKTQNQGKNS